MYFSEDEQIARYLQTELNSLERFEPGFGEKENQNPSDSILELSDPTPSIHDLFVKFDKKFFWGALGMVQVVWSNRMTKCAGMCYFEGKHGLCKIALSAPLLSLRPRKDLVETLLHEMIHAYLFVTNNYRDREDHGTEFHKHMFRINQAAGTNVSVYHTFHDEVEYYQRHIWRCDGPCRYKKPRFGFLKRSINRAPGPHDSWWNQHKMECSGTFIKISEPEKKPKKITRTRAGKTGLKSKNIRDLFQRSKDSKKDKSDDVKSNSKSTEPGFKETEPVNEIKSSEEKVENVEKSDVEKGAFKRKDQNRMDQKNFQSIVKIDEKGTSQGQRLMNTKKAFDGDDNVKNVSSERVREVVRNVWSKKFLPNSEKSEIQPSKKMKIGDAGSSEEVDREEASVRNVAAEENNLNANSVNERAVVEEFKECPVCNGNVFSSEMNDHLENCLRCTFANEEVDREVNCDSVPCPCCYKWFLESEMDSHIDECLTIIALKEERLNLC